MPLPRAYRMRSTLMVIYAQAGLGFEPAIASVSPPKSAMPIPLSAQELSQTASEMRVAANSRTALTNMGDSNRFRKHQAHDIDVGQTLQYGTPLSDALRVLSAEMREEMMIRFETRAARLPVLLTIPMILFILPCIFLIVGGPAVINCYRERLLTISASSIQPLTTNG